MAIMDTTSIQLHSRYTVSSVDPRVFGGFLELMGRAVYDEFVCLSRQMGWNPMMTVNYVYCVTVEFIVEELWRASIGHC
jgi:alpha-L-arabinofuranosidase